MNSKQLQLFEYLLAISFAVTVVGIILSKVGSDKKKEATKDGKSTTEAEKMLNAGISMSVIGGVVTIGGIIYYLSIFTKLLIK